MLVLVSLISSFNRVIAGFGVGVRGKIGLVTIAHEGQSPDAITAWGNAPGTRVEIPASANGALHW